MYTGIKYNKLGKKPPSGGSRTTRISIPADGDDLLEPIVNNGDEEEDEEDDEEEEEDDAYGGADPARQSAADEEEEEEDEQQRGRFDSRRSTAAMAPNNAARGKRAYRYAASTRT
uniref:Uncharacterized protein n=1 Tax=Anopheles culicifacies TaxID=139723 RepID=A0A182LS55_9DIPT